MMFCSSSNYIPETSFRGYYVFGLDAAASAAAAVILLVHAITQTNIYIFSSYLLEWKIRPQGTPLLLLGEMRHPTWPLGGVNRHANHISFNIFWTESPTSAKPISNESSRKTLSKWLSVCAYTIFKMAARGHFVSWKSHYRPYLQNGAS